MSTMRAQRTANRFRLTTIALGLLLASGHGLQAQMSIPGNFDVSATGGAHYKIPIVISPGTAGMVPSLALEYSSETGGNSNGWLGASLVGVGWSLTGLPSIGRCPQTVAQDDVVGAINYNANDRFCLEGQRLIAISGVYGADGTQYRTEVDGFSEIISHGTVTPQGSASPSGPAWFEVHTKSGQVLALGNTPDSQVLVTVLNPFTNQSTTAARSWAVNQVSDTKGNYFTITYTNDTTNGQAYPTQINYTGNAGAGVTPYNSVKFVYATRPNILPVYHAGALMQTTVLLTDVQTYTGSSLVIDYHLTYQQGSATGRSQLTSVSLCDGYGDCMSPTTFTWQNGTTNMTVMNPSVQQGASVAGSRPYLGDFNGDGMTDVMWDSSNSPTVACTAGAQALWTSTGGGSFSANNSFNSQYDASLSTSSSSSIPLVADFNRDGRADVWWYQVGAEGTASSDDCGNTFALGPSTVWMSNANGSYSNLNVTTQVPNIPTADPPITSQLMTVGDINGDQRPDLMWITSQPVFWGWLVNPPNLTNQTETATVVSFNPAPILDSTTNPCPPPYPNASAADFNADGFADLVFNSKDGCVPIVAMGQGNGNFVVAQVGTPTGATSNAYTADFNGDGQSDFLWDTVDSVGRSVGTTRAVWISKGDGTFVVNNNPGNANNSLAGYIATIADFNGDGLSDILWTPSDIYGRATGGATILWLSNGQVSNGSAGFTIYSPYKTPPAGSVPYAGDFNGDGKADVLWDSRAASQDTRSTGTQVLWLSDGVEPDLMTEATTGLGATTTITYQPLTNSAVYTKDNTATDPTVDVQGAMPVVDRVDRSNGIGGTVSTTYAYAGAKMDNSGRGFLGFRQVTSTDLQTNIVTTTNYSQTFPFISQVLSSTSVLGSITLSQTTNTYGSVSLSCSSNATVCTHSQVFLSQTQANAADLDGSVLPSTTTKYTYDPYNNATLIAVSVSDGSSKTTTNQFSNITTSPYWFLGRLTQSQVTSTAP